MRFLIDECTGPGVANWLKAQGFEVFSVFDEAKGATDKYLIEKAYRESWILVSNDKDFGEQVFRESTPHHGVVLLRLDDERTPNKIGVLKQLIQHHAHELNTNFVVLTDSHIRFSRNK